MTEIEFEKLIKARIRVIISQSFFGYLIMKLPIVISEDIPTACTDGTCIQYNPNFVNSLPMAELVGLMCHEILHVALGHQHRRGLRDARRWNAACDYVVNLLLRDVGIALPAGALIDDAYANMSAEEVYLKLPASKGEDEDGDGDQPEQWGQVIDAPSKDPQSPGQKIPKQGISGIDVRAALDSAKMQGKLPGSMETIFGIVLQPKVNWKALLWAFVQQVKDDYTWKRPNRRFMESDLILPSLDGEEVGDIVIAIDTSSSVSQVEVTQFLSECASILSSVRPRKTYLWPCNTRIYNDRVFEKDEILDAEVKIIGGGTSFDPPFERVATEGIQPECMIYLTDLECSFPEPPTYPVLWIASTRRKAPWGETIQISVTEKAA